MADPDAYAIASIVLYSRIWAELERLHDALEAPALLSQILRLEIHLLMQACESWRWRGLMSALQRRALQQTLTDVLNRLEASDDGICPAAAAAQDRLLDAVLDQYSTLRQVAAAAPQAAGISLQLQRYF